LREDKAVVRVRTGLTGVDKMLNGGIRKGYSLVFAADSGVGKTAFLSWVAHDCLTHGHTVIWITFEGEDEEVIDAVVGIEAGVDMNRPRSRWSLDDHTSVAQAQGKISQMPLL